MKPELKVQYCNGFYMNGEVVFYFQEHFTPQSSRQLKDILKHQIISHLWEYRYGLNCR